MPPGPMTADGFQLSREKIWILNFVKDLDKETSDGDALIHQPLDKFNTGEPRTIGCLDPYPFEIRLLKFKRF